MKWIGQHIWDFISRFRSDVYLEATDSGTIASGGNLGLDSNNKVVKATGVSSSTLASTVTVTDSTANTLFPIVFHDESNGLLDDTGALMYNPNGAALTLKGSGNGSFNLMAIADSNNDVHINFFNTKDGGAGADNDNLGTLTFYGKNDAGTPSTLVYGSLTTYIGDASDDDEAGVMTLKVATEGTERQVLTGTGDGASSKVDVGLGYGAASTTTIAGGLRVGGSTAAMTNAGLLSVGSQTNITSVGTLTNLDVDNININGDTITASADLSIVATGDDIAVDTDNFVIESATNGRPNLDIKTTYAGNKPANIYFKKDKGAAGADDDFIGRIYFVSDNDAQEQITFASISGEVRLAADGAEEGRVAINIKNTNHASLPQESFLLTANGAATDVNLGFGATSTTTIAGDLTTNGEDVLFTSSVSAHPVVEIRNTTNDSLGPTLKLNNTHGGNDGGDGDFLGTIQFLGNDDGIPTEQVYGEIFTRIDDVTSGQESGAMYLRVASHDGDTNQGLGLTGGSADGEVDVTIGSGTSSVTTIAGTLRMGSTAAMTNAGLLSVGTQTNITSLGTLTGLIISGAIELGHASDTTLARSAAGIATIEGEQIFTTNTPALTSAAAGVPAVTMQVRRTITTAEANAMNSTPIVLVPAQGANTVIVPLGGMIRVDRAASQTNGSADLALHYEAQEPGIAFTNALCHLRRFMYNEAGDRVYGITGGTLGGEQSQSLTDDVDKAVEVSFDAATTTNCFTSIEVFLTYQVFNIS